jgi:hypothetical protein
MSPTDPTDADYEAPTFDDAAEGLRGLLAARRHPTTILWLSANELIRAADAVSVILGGQEGDGDADGEARARAAYEDALTRDLGVVFEAVCRLGDRVGVVVYGPKDPEEAERLLMGNLVKLSVPARLPEATARWAAC